MSKALNFSILLVVAFIAYCFGKYREFANYTINYTLPIVDVASMVVNVFLATWLATVIDKRKSTSTAEKEIILKRFDKLIESCEILGDTIMKNDVPDIIVFSFRKKTYLALSNICKTIKQQSSSNYEELDQQKVEHGLSILHDLISSSSYEVLISNNIVKYSTVRIAEINNQLEKITGMLVNMQLHINRS